MPAEPLVSFLMPAYKPRPDWLRDAVNSVLTQEGCRLELLVVDDGSPEPVAPLLADIEDPRMRVITAEHGGRGHALNRGAAEATGDYWRFVDADDVLEPGSTARLVALAADQPIPTIAYGGTLYCDQDLRPLSLRGSSLRGWIVEDCLLYRFDVRSLAMVFPRPVVESIGDWDTELRHCQDWDYVLRGLEHAPVVGETRPALFYRVHPGAQTAKLASVLDYESLVVDRYFERHPEQAGGPLERRARAQLLRVRSDSGPALGQGRSERLRTLARAFALDRRGTAAHVGRRLARRVRASTGRPA